VDRAGVPRRGGERPQCDRAQRERSRIPPTRLGSDRVLAERRPTEPTQPHVIRGSEDEPHDKEWTRRGAERSDRRARKPRRPSADGNEQRTRYGTVHTRGDERPEPELSRRRRLLRRVRRAFVALRDAADASERVNRILDPGQKGVAVSEHCVRIEPVRRGKRPDRRAAVNAGRQIGEPSLFDRANVMDAEAGSR